MDFSQNRVARFPLLKYSNISGANDVPITAGLSLQVNESLGFVVINQADEGVLQSIPLIANGSLKLIVKDNAIYMEHSMGSRMTKFRIRMQSISDCQNVCNMLSRYCDIEEFPSRGSSQPTAGPSFSSPLEKLPKGRRNRTSTPNPSFRPILPTISTPRGSVNSPYSRTSSVGSITSLPGRKEHSNTKGQRALFPRQNKTELDISSQFRSFSQPLNFDRSLSLSHESMQLSNGATSSSSFDTSFDFNEKFFASPITSQSSASQSKVASYLSSMPNSADSSEFALHKSMPSPVCHDTETINNYSQSMFGSQEKESKDASSQTDYQITLLHEMSSNLLTESLIALMKDPSFKSVVHRIEEILPLILQPNVTTTNRLANNKAPANRKK